MGLAKEAMMAQQEQGWSYSDKWVCVACVDDYALKAAIHVDTEIAESCDFCGTQGAAPLDSVLAVFVAGLHNEYEDALGAVYHDGREGGWQWWGSKWDTYDLVWDYADVLIGNGLVEAVQDSMHDRTWVEKDFALERRDVALHTSWTAFCDIVKYRMRYVLWIDASRRDPQYPDGDEVPPSQILDEVARLVDVLDLVQQIPAGTSFFRAQTHGAPDDLDPTAARLGTAPRRYARQPTRMSPAGIPMFYGAGDADTAIREAAKHSGDSYVTCGASETSRDCLLVDFTRLPPIPSMFDPERGAMRRHLVFLHNFVKDLSSRVEQDLEHVDYVPTQVLTEYLLRIHGDGTTYVGLLYNSSITGRQCVVLDIPNDHCVEQTVDWNHGDELCLGLETGSVALRQITPADRV